MRGIIIVGQNPGKAVDHPNESPSLRRLYNWLSILGVKEFKFTNTVNKTGKVSTSDIDYKKLFTSTEKYGKILALGNFASAALSKMNVEHFKLPHPSPLNRLLNDKNYEQNILKECKEYLNEDCVYIR